MQLPWRDRRGRFLPLKAAALPLCLLPGLMLAIEFTLGALGSRPITAAIHETGDWAVRFFLMVLAVTPLRACLNWPQALLLRRMLGLTALGYVVVHLLLYVVDQKFALGTVVSEIVLRFYLTIGFVALVGLVALGVTSTDTAIRRMGRGWKRLHRLTYPIGVLALLHFFIQSKADVSEATYAAGLLAWLFLWRLFPDRVRARPVALVALAVLASLATMALEYAWYALATRIRAGRVLEANFSLASGMRPAHWVLITALILTLIVIGRRWQMRPRQHTPRVPPAPSAAQGARLS